MEDHQTSLEASSRDFLKHPDCFKHCLIGSLLAFVPIANIFALGYLYRFSKELRLHKSFNFPSWDDWGKLFIQGLVFLGFNIVFIGLPVLASWIVKHLLLLLSFTLIGFMANLPVTLATFIGPSLCVSALFRYHTTRSFRSLLDIKAILRPLLEHWPKTLLSSFCLLGFMAVLAPLYGIASFVGYAFFIHYCSSFLKNQP